MDDRLRRRAEQNGDVFTWEDVRSCLLGEHDVREVVRAGEAVRVRRNAYVLEDRWRSARPEEQLALRVRAVLLGRPGHTASHQSALALHGIALWGVPTRVVDLMAPVPRTRTVSGVRTHPVDAAIEPVHVGGYATVDIATAVVQVTLRCGVEAGVVALDDALHQRRCRLPQVQAAGERLARGPLDRARVAALVERADPSCESVGESRTRLLLHGLGYDVRSQVSVSDDHGSFVGRVDFMVGGAVVVEFDGMVKYEGADGRGALAREKAREERLTALGCVVIRLVWADLDHPERVRARIDGALARVARRA